MANRISGVIRNQNFRIDRDIVGIPKGEKLVSVVFMVKVSENTIDSDAIINQTITDLLTDLGAITDDASGDGTGSFYLQMKASATKALLMHTPPSGALNQVKYTAVTAGYNGNKIKITYVNLGINQSLTVTVSESDITVSLATDGGGAVTSTGVDVINLINADPDASLLVLAEPVAGSGGVVAPTTQQTLSGGNGGTVDLGKDIYVYQIWVNTDKQGPLLFESGDLIVGDVFESGDDRSLASTAMPWTGTPRVMTIINEYVDSIIHEFRQLRVWDEQVRRSSNDPYRLELTYKNWNKSYYPQIFDDDNDRVQPDEYQINYDDGYVKIDGDNGHGNYYVTYEFNLFPSIELDAFLRLTLQELNLAGAEGRFITHYSSVDQTPVYWDAPLAYGVAAKAFKRLETSSGLWKNYLIWAEKNSGAQLAGEASNYYQQLFESTSKNIKQLYFIANPSPAFNVFRTVGFGALSITSSKFREFRVNRITGY